MSEDNNVEMTMDVAVYVSDVTCKRKDRVVIIPDVRVEETIGNLKPLILDIPEVCHITACHLEVLPRAVIDEHISKLPNKNNKKTKKKSLPNGVLLNEQDVISSCTSLSNGDVIVVVPENYDAQTCLNNVTRFKHILVSPPGPIANVTPKEESKSQEETKTEEEIAKEQEEVFRKMEGTNVPVRVNLGSFYPGKDQTSNKNWLLGVHEIDEIMQKPLPDCVREISISGWGPPTSREMLAGDFVYLRVVTMELDVLHVTGSMGGFFVNGSTDDKFNPKIVGSKFSTLAELLVNASEGFVNGYVALMAAGAERIEAVSKFSGLAEYDIASMGPNWNPTPAWNQRVMTTSKRVMDTYRSNVELRERAGVLQAASGRDWNEEYQLVIELPLETLEDRVERARQLERLYSDYEASVVAAATAVAQGQVEALNPMDPEALQVFVVNSIFISTAQVHNGIDIERLPSQTQMATYCSSNHDLQGVVALNRATEVRRAKGENVELHTLNTMLVDYMGKRMIAQTIVPGVLQKDHKVLYGCINGGETIECDAVVDEEMKKSMELLHIGESPIESASGVKGTLHAHAGSKSIRGTDGRLYVLDLLRTSPIDLTFYESRNVEKPTESEDFGYIALLRPELVERYVRSLNRESIAEKQSKAQKAVVDYRESIGKPISAEQPADLTEEETTEAERLVTEAIKNVPTPDPIFFDANAYSPHQKEPSKDASDMLTAFAKFLTESTIPEFMDDLRGSGFTIADGVSLVRNMHSYGINMRYLGMIADLCVAGENVTSTDATGYAPIARSVAETCEIEMVARAFKWVLRLLLNRFKNKIAPIEIIRDLLNMLFEVPTSSAVESSFESVASMFNTENRHASVLHAYLRHHVEQHFKYSLKFWLNAKDAKSHLRVHPLPMLRRVCQLTGIRMDSKDYAFGTKPFTVEDIEGVVPLTKSCKPEYCLREVFDLIENARVRTQTASSKEELMYAFEMANEAMNFTCRIATSVHPNATSACHLLGLVLSRAGEYTNAIVQQKRLIGLLNARHEYDSFFAAQSYAVLGNYYIANGDIISGIIAFRRSIYIFELIGGPESPEVAMMYHRMGTAYGNYGHMPLAFACVHEALKRSGSNKIQSASFLRTAAQIFAGSNDWTQAFEYEKSAYTIRKEIFGVEDARTKECAKWLEVYTRKSVVQLRELQNKTESEAAIIPKTTGQVTKVN